MTQHRRVGGILTLALITCISIFYACKKQKELPAGNPDPEEKFFSSDGPVDSLVGNIRASIIRQDAKRHLVKPVTRYGIKAKQAIRTIRQLSLYHSAISK